MKSKHSIKLMVSLLSISLMFYGIYAVAYAFTNNNEIVILPGNTNASFAAAPVQVAKTTSQAVVWTPKTLAVNNGQNGKPAYIAVDGIVYDMSKLAAWKGGVHKGIKAGTDASEAFKGSPHAKTILKLAKEVGTYSPKEAVAVSSATAKPSEVKWTTAVLKQYNGNNGNPAYIAVNGVIYDVTGSKAWRSGSHKGVAAGQDVTKAFANSPHGKSLLASLPVVAKIGDPMTASSKAAKSTTPMLGSKGSATYGDDDDDDDEDDDDEDDEDSDHDD